MVNPPSLYLPKAIDYTVQFIKAFRENLISAASIHEDYVKGFAKKTVSICQLTYPPNAKMSSSLISQCFPCWHPFRILEKQTIHERFTFIKYTPKLNGRHFHCISLTVLEEEEESLSRQFYKNRRKNPAEWPKAKNLVYQLNSRGFESQVRQNFV